MTPVQLPYSEDFCCSVPAAWTIQSSNEGRVQIRDGRLLLDDSVTASAYSLNEATVAVDLANQDNVVLRFDHRSHGDERHLLPETFTGSANGDGLALSVNGVNWFRVTEFNDGENTVNLSQFMTSKGIAPSANTRLKFMQYDNYSANIDGRSFDNIRITGRPVVIDPAAVPVSIPYRQAFSSKPDATKGWMYESSHEGRIEVIGGALRLDSKGIGVYSQNKAVLHVKLGSARNPVLRFRARESSDERNSLPISFGNSAKGDGVAVSANGVDWVRVVDLDHGHRDWRSYKVNLADSGIRLGANTRIAFMQYDNYNNPTDGWEFDDVSIQEEAGGVVVPLQPPLVSTVTIPAGNDFAEAPLDYWSIGSADTADGTVPNNRQSRDTTRKVHGAASIRFDTDSAAETRVGFPTTRDANWDLRSVRTLRFNLFSSNNTGISGPELSLVSGEDRFIYTPAEGAVNMVSANGQWVTVEIPLAGSAAWKRTTVGNPSLADIDALELMADSWDFGFSFWLDDLRFDPAVKTVLPGLRSPDLTIGRIERTPKYESYHVEYPGGKPRVLNPNTKRWPDLNERVTWTAHIANRGQVRASTFALQWYVNNQRVQTTRHKALQPGATTRVDLVRNWLGSQEVRAEIVPDFPGERTVRNNALSIDSEAMTYSFVVEQSVFNLLNNIPNRLGSTACEDWLNSTLDDLDRRFALSTYDFAPNGAEMRVRLDKLTIVPDGAGFGGQQNDLEVDGRWLFPVNGLGEYTNYNILYNTPLAHELTHQLGVIDTYHLGVGKHLNQLDDNSYGNRYDSLMGGSREPVTFSGSMLDPLSVYGINSTLGYRRGHYGVYLFDLPRFIRVQVLKADGSPLSWTEVAFYQRDQNTNLVDPIAEFSVGADVNGYAYLPNREIEGGGVATATGQILRANPFGLIDVVGKNGTFLMQVRHEGRTFIQEFIIADAILAYARGKRSLYTIQLQTDF